MRKPSVWEVHIPRLTEMRRSGYTLQEIGDYFGVTRERVRQILQEHCGKIEIPLLTETRVAKEIGCPISRLRKLRKEGTLKPEHRGKYLHYYAIAELERVKLTLQRRCLDCGESLAINHNGKYCSSCREERRRKKHILSQDRKRTRERQ